MQLESADAYGIYEPESGTLLARRAVAAVVEDAVYTGVDYVVAAVDPPCRIPAANYVYACGPWLPKLFPDILGGRITPTRQEVFFFATPPGSDGFFPARLPVWLDFTDPRHPYGFPDIESRGFKLAFDSHGATCDPDALDRRVSAEGIAEARDYLARRFPALRDAPLNESRVCQYENTSSGDFLIDRHPEFSNVWFAGGGSGHGFKHGPAVGEYVCGQILGQSTPEPRFSLASKALERARAVY